MDKSYYAHTSCDGSRQLLIEHLKNTASICTTFAKSMDMPSFGKCAGEMHDLGKYSKNYQDRLLNSGPKCDHSTAGARVINEIEPEYGIVLAYIIAGHHAGLSDWGSPETGLNYRLNTKNIPDYSDYLSEVASLPKLDYEELNKKIAGATAYKDFKVSFAIRMLYSCLVDADFLETESFMEKGKNLSRESQYNLNDLYVKLNDFMASLHNNSKGSNINDYRNLISKRCLKQSYVKPGLFSLTVPTGGGKTLSSMLFALNHAVVNNLKRVIVVIPYTSIIEQNAKVYSDIFGVEYILEHHCNFSFDKESHMHTDSEYSFKVLQRLKLASENWDIAITVTTNVQFFESLFANTSSRCRKLHNIANSVVIIDEAQMIPYAYIKPCLLAVDELVQNYNSTVVLTTATQPEFPKIYLQNEIVEIIEHPKELYQKFRRTKIVNLGEMSDQELISHFVDKPSYLVIVNRKKHARELYKKINERNKSEGIDTPIYHLSGNMCPLHRTRIIAEIKALLAVKKPCILIATNLVECGVDISFPTVYREYSGLDSFIQSAGRCNRNGELDEFGIVYVFESKDNQISSYINNQVVQTRYILQEFDDPISLDAIATYFRRLYHIDLEKLDAKKIISDCFEYDPQSLHYKFKTAAERFRIMNSSAYNIVVIYDEHANKLVNDFVYTKSKKILRELQVYTVQVEQKYFDQLELKCLESLMENLYVLRDKNRYSEDVGLILG